MGVVRYLHRVFRQVHRVLKNRGAFVFSYEHPIGLCVGREPPETPSTPISRVVRMSYFTDDPVTVEHDGQPIRLYVRTVSEVFHALSRGGFRVEVLAEPRPPCADALVPRAILSRRRNCAGGRYAASSPIGPSSRRISRSSSSASPTIGLVPTLRKAITCRPSR